MKRRPRIYPALALLWAAAAAGCAAPDQDYSDLSDYYRTAPKTILVLPARNQSTDAEASWFYMATVGEPLVERGYYVMPVTLVSEILTREGVDPGAAWDIDPARAYDYLGADAILYVTIEEWDTFYAVMASSVKVAIDYRLVDTRTGGVIWEHRGARKVTAGGHGQGLVGLLLDAAESAIVATTIDYVPLAAGLNAEAFSTLPPGAYHPDYPALRQKIEAWEKDKARESGGMGSGLDI